MIDKTTMRNNYYGNATRCALAHGKLCFELLKTFRVTRNHLPRWGKSSLRSRVIFDKNYGND